MKLSNANKINIAKKIGSKRYKIAFCGLSISIKGPPIISPHIENPPKKIKPTPNMSIVHPF